MEDYEKGIKGTKDEQTVFRDTQIKLLDTEEGRYKTQLTQFDSKVVGWNTLYTELQNVFLTNFAPKK